MAEYDRMAEVWTTCFETNPLAGLRTLAWGKKIMVKFQLVRVVDLWISRLYTNRIRQKADSWEEGSHLRFLLR